MLQAIAEHSTDQPFALQCKKILAGEIDTKELYRNTGAFTRGILDGDFKKAIKYADTLNIVAFIAELATGNYDMELHKLCREREKMIGLDRPKFTEN
jgi:hypothetical protein